MVQPTDERPEPAEPARADRRTRNRRLLAGAAIAAVGGLVGGALVALVGWAAGWGDDPAGRGRCDVEDVAARALPSVVTVNVRSAQGSGNGSGIVYDLEHELPGGGRTVIVTNEHVVAPPTPAPPGGPPPPVAVEITYTDGHSTPASIRGVDALTDLAVLVPEDPSSAAEPIRVADSGGLRVGAPVVALGSPLGLTSTVTSGVVSATGRYVRVPSATGAAHIIGAIQTDAAINPGNSGGALVDCRARLVGVNTAGASPAGEIGSSGLGFAIPTVLAGPLVAELAENGRVGHPTLGLRVQAIPASVVEQAGGRVFVQALLVDGPAAQAGLQPGDILVTAGGRDLQTPDDLVRLELELNPGDEVVVTFLRGGEQREATLTAISS